MSTATATATETQTPDEWLLTEFDREVVNPYRRTHTHERPMFELIEDHEKDVNTCGYCNPSLYVTR